MRVTQRCWTADGGWEPPLARDRQDADLVLVFGGTSVFEDGRRLVELGEAYPAAVVFGCSTAGEIYGTRVDDDSLSVTAVKFERTALRYVLGENVPLTGFYSYGEISPFTPNAKCELHNQTMTITTFSEPQAA
jgi:hypothetical protein